MQITESNHNQAKKHIIMIKILSNPEKMKSKKMNMQVKTVSLGGNGNLKRNRYYQISERVTERASSENARVIINYHYY